MHSRPKIGLLPLYLTLYDQTSPERRDHFVPMMDEITSVLLDGGVETVRAEICCVREETQRAVEQFEREEVALIVTLHLAYSPSLESAEVLAETSLPILMLDTTMDHSFGPDVARARIFYDHGIHGVQDLASVLRRMGKSYDVVAGHFQRSNVLARVREAALAAHAARVFRNTRAVRIGEAFAGMGDFAVPDALLRENLGISVEQLSAGELCVAANALPEDAIDAELALDRRRFRVEVDEETHRASLRMGLALRGLLDAGGYGAFSMNFQAFQAGGAEPVPFLEACKAMARGTGYAGEGDVLTAALVGALASALGRTSFTEIFCPDWHGESLFLSHMGEINPDVAAETPRVVEMDFPYTSARNPAILACGFAPGPATLVNLSPGPCDSFDLITAEVEMLGDTSNPDLQDSIRGWMRPTSHFGDGIAAFLERYSSAGGTHHSALVYGHHGDLLRRFAEYAGLGYSSVAP